MFSNFQRDFAKVKNAAGFNGKEGETANWAGNSPNESTRRRPRIFSPEIGEHDCQLSMTKAENAKLSSWLPEGKHGDSRNGNRC
jgi:hypothetical protein